MLQKNSVTNKDAHEIGAAVLGAVDLSTACITYQFCPHLEIMDRYTPIPNDTSD